MKIEFTLNIINCVKINSQVFGIAWIYLTLLLIQDLLES